MKKRCKRVPGCLCEAETQKRNPRIGSVTGRTANQKLKIGSIDTRQPERQDAQGNKMVTIRQRFRGNMASFSFVLKLESFFPSPKKEKRSLSVPEAVWPRVFFKKFFLLNYFF